MAGIRQLQSRAESGDPEAAYVLACTLNRGLGVKPSRSRGERWLRVAAERGYHGALCVLFERYRDRDLPRALEYGERCIHSGDSHTAIDVALQLIYGRDHGFDLTVPLAWSGRDPKIGLRWLEDLARKGSVDAMANLCETYSSFSPIRRDRRKAEYWARRALRAGDTEPMLNLGVRFKYGSGIRKDVRGAVRCYRLASRHGDAIAWHNLGLSFKYGEGARQDHARYLACMRKSALLGYPSAKRQIAMAYWDGLGVRRDRKRAVRLAAQLMRAGDLDSGAWYGCVLTEIDGDRRAQERGVEILKKYARLGSDAAANDLAAYLHEREPRSRWLPQALRYYKRAIELGSTTAMENFARCHLDGHKGLLRKNRRAAIALLRRASEIGDDDARRLLGEVERFYRKAGQRKQAR
jgi:TPR repeat protein